MSDKTTVIPGFKGFDKDLKCRDYQFEVGKDYEEERAKACVTGFHYCENPLDVFNYYPPGTSRYAVVEGSGQTDRHDEDSKVAATHLSVKAEVNLPGVIKAGVEFIFGKSEKKNITYQDKEYAATTGYLANAATTGNWANAATTGYRANAATTGEGANAATTGNWANAATTGYRANAATTGYRANAATTGEGANAATTGYRANAATTGRHAIAAGIGIENKAKAALGSWIVLAEWVWKESEYQVKSVQSAQVDGDKIKADTYYQLKNGEFVEAD